MTIAPLAATGGAAPVTKTEQPDAKTVEHFEGFEKLLLGQLTKELVETAMPDGEEAAAATGAYKQMLPDALTEALMSGGGIGLAKQLAEGAKQ